MPPAKHWKTSPKVPGAASILPSRPHHGDDSGNRSFRSLPIRQSVRRIIYTTNAIESLNSKLRTAVRSRGHFPNDEAATKLLFLVLREVSREWKMPPREWAAAK